MKKALIFIILSMFVLTHSPGWAFLYDFKFKTKEEIKALSDAEMINTYIDAKIELDASRSFHGEAGFTPKEYERHKKLLKYIIKLRLEMRLRELDVPPIDDWIR